MSLIFDTETSGLPNCKWYGHFPLYNSTKDYDQARVVQVTYIITDSFLNKLEESDTIIKLDRFVIDNHEFHGITNEISMEKGIPFEEFAEQFNNALDFVDTIIAHNINFDFNVICAEMYRYGFMDIIKKFESKKQICTMKKYKNLVGATFKGSTKGGIKDPNLKEFYHYATGQELENHHNSYYDTLHLWKALKCLN